MGIEVGVPCVFCFFGDGAEGSIGTVRLHLAYVVAWEGSTTKCRSFVDSKTATLLARGRDVTDALWSVIMEVL